ncbi:MAG: nicotinamide-nucleotide amidase [Actinomycetota bacterium]|jgi:nicotinamide-nucleotide amidase
MTDEQGDELADLFEHNELTLAVAESLTGGLLADTFAQLPGAGSWFKGGLVAYSADVKQRLLGIGDAPVVSKAAVVAMVQNVAELLEADVAVAVTGVGGPGAEDGVAPGTVWMAVRTPDRTVAALRNFPGEPEEVIHHACSEAFAAVREAVSSIAASETV